MRSEPEYPIISIYNNKGLDILNSKDKYKYASLSSINSSEEDTLYYSKNNKWTCSFVRKYSKKSFAEKLLPVWVFNPSIEFIRIWKNKGDYQISELKELIQICLDKDDDILTQYEDFDFLYQKIKEAKNFHEVSTILNRYIFEVNEEELWKEHELRYKDHN